jgi:hypothetical protein
MVRYSPEIAKEICERLAQGESLRAICEDIHMPSAGSVIGWVNNDTEGFAEQYARARIIGYQLLADELLHLADTPQRGSTTTSKEWGDEIKTGDMIEHRKLQVDTRKWMLSKMLPKVYGDKQQVEHSGTINTANTILEARKRSGRS